MFNSTSIKSTLRVEPTDIRAFHCERPTIRISRAELSGLLLDVLSDIGTDQLEIEVEWVQ